MRNLLETGMRDKYLRAAGAAFKDAHEALTTADSAADPAINVQSIKDSFGRLANAVLTKIPGEPEEAGAFLIADGEIWAQLTGRDAHKAFETTRATERGRIEELARYMESVVVAAHGAHPAREVAAMSSNIVLAMGILDKLRNSDDTQWCLGGLDDFANVHLVIVQGVGRRLSQMLVDATSSCADFAKAFKDDPDACFKEELTGVRDDSFRGGDDNEDAVLQYLLTLAEQVRQTIAPRLHMLKDDASVSAELNTLCSFPPWLAVGQDLVTLAKASLGDAEAAGSAKTAEAATTMTRAFNKIVSENLVKVLDSGRNARGAIHVVEAFRPQIQICSDKSGEMISEALEKLIELMGDRIVNFCKAVSQKKRDDPADKIIAASFSSSQFAAVTKSSEQQTTLLTALRAPLVEACHTMIQEAMNMYQDLSDAEAQLEYVQKQFPFARSCLEGPSEELKKVMNKFNESDLPHVACALSNWTAAMACFRDVKPGETRKGLCQKICRGLSQRCWHKMSPHVSALIMSLAGVAGESTKSE